MHIGNWFLRIGVLYIIAGVTLGNIMGATGDHSLHPVHAHLNLLGWVAMSLFGLFYRAFPGAMAGTMAKVHFWIYVPVHLIQMVSLTLLYRGNAALEPVLAVSSMVVGLTFVLFGVIVWQATRGTA